MAAPDPAEPPAWTSLTDRTWLVRGAAATNTLVVQGARGLVVVDPPLDISTALPDGLAGELVAVVLTHAHAGEDRAWPEAALHVHEGARLDAGTAVRRFSSVALVDLGDRVLELVHPGRGHTEGDLVVRVPDVDLVAVGGLASGDGVPSYGTESFPLEWPAALDLVLGLSTPRTTVVPRSGAVLTRTGLDAQRALVGVVAETIADVAGRGVAVDDALDAAEWPLPVDRLREAVRRGYDQLPRTARRLPLL
jgi:glyoxylase-like metal-dependent hydrolase (beta-lactamase superfamily II)